MLVISDGQKEAFDRAQLKSFEDRMVAHLRAYLPEQMEAEAPAKERVRWRLGQDAEKAASYLVVQEHNVAVYLSALFAVRADPLSDAVPVWTRAALEEPELSPTERTQLVRYLAEAELKAGAAESAERGDARHSRAVRLRAAALAARREFGRNAVGNSAPPCAQVGMPEDAIPPASLSALLAKSPAVCEVLIRREAERPALARLAREAASPPDTADGTE